MAPSVSVCLQHHCTTIQNVICCAFVSTQFALVGSSIFPAFEVGGGWESVDACIEHELERAGLELEHA